METIFLTHACIVEQDIQLASCASFYLCFESGNALSTGNIQGENLNALFFESNQRLRRAGSRKDPHTFSGELKSERVAGAPCGTSVVRQLSRLQLFCHYAPSRHTL